MKELTKIPADKIDHSDRRFIYRVGPRRSEWILPVFWEKDGQFVPVIEFREFDQNEIPAFIYRQDCDYEDILLDTLKSEELSAFDTARLMKILDEYRPSLDKKAWSKVLRVSIDKWDTLKGLADYETRWQDYFIDKKAPLKRILHFSDTEVRRTLQPLLGLNPGINMLESIAALMENITHRDKKEISVIWQELETDTILSADDKSVQQKLKEIKDKLFGMRYPTIAKYRNELDEHLRTIPRAAKVDLRSDENFETPGMILQADLRSRRDIEILQDWLDKQKPELEKIMDIQKGKEGKGK
jgi:hypothetical protein